MSEKNMIEAFTLLLAIPEAIEASSCIIDRLKSRKNSSDGINHEYEELESKIEAIRKNLLGFSISFAELFAWKYLHNITTRLLLDLDDAIVITFGSDNIHDFKDKVFPNKKESIVRSLNSTDLSSIPSINIYESRKEYHHVLACLNTTNAGEIPWNRWIKECLNKIKRDAHNSHADDVYTNLQELRRYTVELNRRADDEIIKCLESYQKDNETLKKSIGK